MQKLFILWFAISVELYLTKFDTANFLVYGPGLDSSINLPVRYFFVQIVGENDEKLIQFNEELTDNMISVRFQFFKSGNFISIHHDVFYVGRGLFIIRFRLLRSILNDNLVISLLWLPTATFIGSQTFLLNSPIYSEKCHCPQFSLNYWLTQKLKCPDNYKQIEEDFSQFQEIEPEKSFINFYNMYHPFTSVAVCRYKILSNKIYRKCFGDHVGFNIFSDAALLSLSHKVKLPDLDFLLNLGDWPLSIKNKDKFAILSWCGSKDSYDIVTPSYETMEWVLEMMNRVYLDIFTVLKDSLLPWRRRLPKSFWRGRDSSEARLNLVRKSLKHADILDAKLTRMFFFPNDSTLGTLEKPISFTDFFKYKYLINMDGTVAAYRFPLSLAGGSLLLKEESKYYEYIYSQLTPGKHYLSIKTDLSDLFDKIKWSISNDHQSQKIAENARQFTLSKLMPVDVFCYYGRVLEAYHNHTYKSGSISFPQDYELITDKFQESNCECFDYMDSQNFYNEL